VGGNFDKYFLRSPESYERHPGTRMRMSSEDSWTFPNDDILGGDELIGCGGVQSAGRPVEKDVEVGEAAAEGFYHQSLVGGRRY